MTTLPGGSLTLADDLILSRMGYGAMQLAGPGVWGPPRDPKAAVAVLREAVELGVTHIDTSDFYGPATVNETIREALHPYREGLHIATKVGGTPCCRSLLASCTLPPRADRRRVREFEAPRTRRSRPGDSARWRP